MADHQSEFQKSMAEAKRLRDVYQPSMAAVEMLRKGPTYLQKQMEIAEANFASEF